MENKPTKDTISRMQRLEDMRAALLNMLEDTEGARRDAEEERNKVQTIIANLADGLLVFDTNWRLDVINPHAEKIFGVKKEEVLGLTKRELERFPNMVETLKIVNEVDDVFRREITIQNFVLAVTKAQIRLNRKPMGVMVIFHDITREKEIERLKTEFVSLTAHQLRTPLSSIKWVLRAFSDGEIGELTEKQKEMIEKTYRSNERMISLINDLLNVTRIEEGRYLYQPVLFHITDIIDGLVTDYKDILKRKNITLKIQKPRQKLPRVLVDVEKITLALQNILDNAVKYTPANGSITISVASPSPKTITIAITDTGMGIPKKQQARVFGKFFRATNAKTVDTEGSGLGLYLVKNIIEAHGGKVAFSSQEKKGTTFTITLPTREEVGEFLKKF